MSAASRETDALNALTRNYNEVTNEFGVGLSSEPWIEALHAAAKACRHATVLAQIAKATNVIECCQHDIDRARTVILTLQAELPEQTVAAS